MRKMDARGLAAKGIPGPEVVRWLAENDLNYAVAEVFEMNNNMLVVYYKRNGEGKYYLEDGLVAKAQVEVPMRVEPPSHWWDEV